MGTVVDWLGTHEARVALDMWLLAGMVWLWALVRHRKAEAQRRSS